VATPRESKKKIAAIALGVLLLGAGCTTFKQCAYEGFGRDEDQQPARVIEALDIAPGDSVADLGAGSGYFTFRLAEATGPTGTVYAVDIDEEMLDLVMEEARERNAANVERVLAEPEDPKLPDGEIDLVFTSNTYHHIGDREQYFARLKRDLSPRGRVAILDYDEDASGFVSWFGHTTERATVEAEMQRAGYRLVAAPDFLEEQTFLIFAPEASPPTGGS
jgi:ubiquinone/menaquinone biosynthesis C-methylase UbiE